MSHSHRDEHDLAEPVVDEPAPVVVVPPVLMVSNTEAERRAAERRKAEGVPEQTTQHQFTGDLPEPSRGGTDTETRLRFGADDGDDERASATPRAASRRGPPPPRAPHLEDEGSWAAPATLDAVGSDAFAITHERWLAPERDRKATTLADEVTRSWTRPLEGE